MQLQHSLKNIERKQFRLWLTHTRSTRRAGIISICFLFFFTRKTGKLEEQETFPKFGNCTGGNVFGRLRIRIFGGRIENMEIQKIARKQIWTFF